MMLTYLIRCRMCVIDCVVFLIPGSSKSAEISVASRPTFVLVVKFRDFMFERLPIRWTELVASLMVQVSLTM